MPRVQTFKKITEHYFPNKKCYTAAMERGLINEGDKVFIDGEEQIAFRIDETLKLSDDGILSVNTAKNVEKDNTLPITAAAVHTTVGNIEILLATI